MTSFQFQTVPYVHFKPGCIEHLGDLLKSFSGVSTRPVLIVTDPGIVSAGLLEAPLNSLKETGIEPCIFSEVQADPPVRVIEAATQMGRSHQVGAVIGFGGGSAMDTAKVVALLLGGEQSLEDMYGVDKASGPRLPLFLIPTTSGTGSEVTPIAVITTGETTKMGINAPPLYADMAILDPDLTLGLPRHITAATGIDAMVHAIEAITSKIKRNPVSHALALGALRLLHGSIVTACEEPGNRQARTDMMAGALMAGQAFANAPVGAVHGLAYPLGGHFHVPHGLSNSLVLPHVLRFNMSEADDDYFAIASHLGLERSADALVAECEHIAKACGIKTQLRQVGVQKSDLTMLAEDAMKQTRLLVNNPRDMTQDAALEIYRQAF